MKRIILVIILAVFGGIASAETIIYDTITPSNYKILQIDDVTNIKYVDEYKYSVYLNGSFLGEYEKGDKIQITDNSNVTIVIPANIKHQLNSNAFAAMIGVGFYSFMQYGVYIVIIMIIIVYLIRRK